MFNIAFLQIQSEADFSRLLFCLLGIYIIFSCIQISLKAPRGIHKAVLDNKMDLVKQYLDNGINIDAEENQNATPLILAIRRNLLEITELLISKGANVNYNIDCENKLTPLYEAVVFEHHEAIELLLKNGAVLDSQTAAFLGKIEVIKKYLEQGADINAGGYQQKSLLHLAVEANQLELAQFLIDRGANVNAKDRDRETPLHSAAYRSDGDKLVELLLNNGSAVDASSKNGTPLLISARRNHVRIAEILIEKGANVNARFYLDKQPLLTYVVSNARCYDVIKLLIENGADVNAYDKFNGDTALHKVAYSGHIDIARLLISNGAKVNFRNSYAKTPLSSAENRSNPDMYVFLVRCGAIL